VDAWPEIREATLCQALAPSPWRRTPMKWIDKHPWMTFFLVGGAIGTVGTIITAIAASSTPTPVAAAGTGASPGPGLGRVWLTHGQLP
jgi:drug/metabolite transporter (DMT)-like permease